MLRTQIKAGSVTNLTDARYFAAREVQWLGFALEPALENYLDPNEALAIREWIEGPHLLGEFQLLEPEAIEQIAKDLKLEAIQLGPLAKSSTCQRLSDGWPVIRQVVVEPEVTEDILESQLSESAPYVRHFLLDFQKNGFSWEALQQEALISLDWLHTICEEYSVFLALDFKLNQAAELLDRLQPYGLELRGGAEEKVGFKSFDALDELLDHFEILET